MEIVIPFLHVNVVSFLARRFNVMFIVSHILSQRCIWLFSSQPASSQMPLSKQYTHFSYDAVIYT